MTKESFEQMMTGGHPNSLGRTIEVVECVLASPERFSELFDCYGSSNEVVRLRVSNAMKRVEAQRSELLHPYINRFIEEIGTLDQASAQWTIAQLFERLASVMTENQKERAQEIMKRNLEYHNDWIVLNATTETLATWAQKDEALKLWLIPQLERLSNDPRKSVAKRALKKRALLKKK